MRTLAAVALGLGLAGCGTNRPEIPPELLANPDAATACSSPGYPSGPYGAVAGNLVQERCFQGWLDPARTTHDEATLETVSLGNFYDPRGDRYELLLLNTSAVWCQVCKNEHRDLPDRYAALHPRGLEILSALFQDGSGGPATVDDLTLWVETFHVEFPMVLDAEFQLGDYFTAESAPLNLVIDARTMRIVEKFVGDQSDVLWPLVEDELARREAE